VQGEEIAKLLSGRVVRWYVVGTDDGRDRDDCTRARKIRDEAETCEGQLADQPVELSQDVGIVMITPDNNKWSQVAWLCLTRQVHLNPGVVDKD
jgi:hypothetical protein